MKSFLSLYYGMWGWICLTAKLSKCIHIEKYPQRTWYVSSVSTIHCLVNNKNLDDVNNNCSISLTSFLSSLCWLSACPYFFLWCARVLSRVPPGSSVHGIFQTRILERVAISSSRPFFWSRDGTQGSNPHLLHLLHWQVNSVSPRHFFFFLISHTNVYLKGSFLVTWQGILSFSLWIFCEFQL